MESTWLCRPSSQVISWSGFTLWHRHTGHVFSGAALDRLREMAAGIARNLYYGYFGVFPIFRFEDDRAVEIITV